MSLESMKKLADEYILSNGMVNYLYCFRNYLGDITGMESSGAAAYGSSSFGTTSNSFSNSGRCSMKELHLYEHEYIC